MNQILTIALVGLFALHFSSCNDTTANESVVKQKGAANEIGSDNVIMFKVNDQLVKTTGWTISRFKLTTDSKESLNITTDMHEEKRTLNVNLEGTEPGTYGVKGDATFHQHFYGSYYPDYMNDLTNDYSFEDGAFIITEIDTAKNIINCIFSGTVKNLKGESFNITEGKIIKGRLTPGVTTYE